MSNSVSRVAEKLDIFQQQLPDLRMAPVMRVKTNNPWVRLHLERLFINKHNLVEDGINNVL